MATITVGVSGDFTTIAAAIAAASANDTIIVEAGNYTETVVIDKAVTLLGANTGIAGSGVRGAESSVLGTFILAADGVTIDGFGFGGGASAIRGQAGAAAYDDLTITNNRIANTTDSAIRFGLGSGGGIGSENWVVSGNQIDAINGANLTGMVLFNVTGLTVTDNVVNHNLATAIGRRGINLDGVQDATVSGNTIDMGLVAPTDATAASSATPWAIQLSMSDRVASNVDVTGNTIGGSSTGIVGLSQRSMVDVDITGNTIANVINGVVLNGGSTSPVVAGVTMDVDVTGNTISAAVNAVLVRDLHGAAPNGPVVFDGLDVTGNTVTQGVVQIGRAETFVPAGASGPGNGLLNISGTATIDGSAFADTVQVEGSGAIVFNAGSGNDRFIGGSGDDLFLGGGGIDTASYTAILTAASIATVADADLLTAGDQAGWAVATGGSEGTDSNSGVEIVDGAEAGRFLLVGNGGFATIQAAVDAASAGDTIIVAAGSYAESVALNKAVTLQGANAGITGTGARGTETIIQGQVTISADAVFDGFRVLNTSANGVAFYGVSVTGAFDATIANNVFFSTGINGTTTGGEDRAINLDTTATGNIDITSNLFTGAALANFSTASWARGIWSDGAAASLDIDGNSFSWVRSAINLDGYEDSRTSVNNNDFVQAGSGISVGLNAVGSSVVITDFTLNSFGNVGTDFNLQNIGASKAITLALNGTGSLPIPGQPMTVLLGQGNDVFSGTSRVDVVVGNGGDDLIFGGADNDVLVGGAGIDEAVYADSLILSQLSLLAESDPFTPGNQPGWQLTSGIDGTDVLSGIEIVDGNEAGRFLLVGSGGFATIQAAIDASTSGDTILIASGTYTEQLTIIGRTDLTLQAASSSDVIVKAPALLAVNGASEHWGVDVRAVIAVSDSTGINLNGLVVDGSFAGDTTPGSNGNELAGIAFLNSSGSIASVEISKVSNSVGGGLFGLQHGVGILVDGTSSIGDAVSISDTTVTDFQKTGILVWGVENLDITNGQVTGIGATDLIGQNGIQVGGSGTTITGNSIGGIGYSPATVYGAALIVYEPTGATQIDGNAFTGAGAGSAGIDLTDTLGQPVTITNNVFTGLDYGILGYSFSGGALGLDVNPLLAGNSFANIAELGLYIDPEFSVFDPFTTTTAFNLTGTQFADELAGSDGNDSFSGGSGADSIDGRAGTDTATFAGNWADYAIGLAGGAYTLTGADGPDVVRNVENFVFADGTLGVADILNDAPFALAFADVTIAENTAAGTNLGTATASDLDTLDTLSFSLVDDAGGRFVIDAATGVVRVAVGAVLDRETAASHAITVAVTDLGGLTTEVDAVVTLTDVDEFNVSVPTDIDPAANSVAEGAIAGIVVGVVVAAIDADATTSTVSYALTDNAGGRFAIHATTGVITVLDGSLLDFETAISHDVEVTASSTDGSTSIAAFNIAVTNVVESQFFIGTNAAETFTAPTDDNWTVDTKGGADTITTAGGDDSVAAGLGNDTISTGGGNDIILFKGNSSANGFDVVNGGAGTDELRALANNTIISLASVTGVEIVNANGFGNVTVLGSSTANVLDFSGATMTGIVAIRGGGGNDTITGSLSNDVIRGEGGNDALAGGFGDDVFQVGLNHGFDSIDGGDGFDSVIAIASNAKIGISSYTGLELISAGGFTNVTLVGTTAANTLDFSGVALAGIAFIDASGGNDSIIGSAGADVIKAGAGKDTLTGGGGADIFDFDLLTDSRTGGAADIINDFAVGIDKIDLSSIDANTAGVPDNQAFSFIGSAAFSNTAGELRFDTSVPGITRIFGDTDGNGVANFEIQLTGTLALTAVDFIA